MSQTMVRESCVADYECNSNACQANARYKWKRINFARFLYDQVENIYIPENIYNALRNL